MRLVTQAVPPPPVELCDKFESEGRFAIDREWYFLTACHTVGSGKCQTSEVVQPSLMV